MSDDRGLAEKLTRVYLKIRSKKADIAAEFKKQDDELTRQLDKVKGALLDYCKE